jgi:undecaprenyl diphosphate synthase
MDPARMPAHIAIIMDGNGRWARKHHLPSRLLGHQRGYRTVKDIVRDAADLDLKVLTLYVFSHENWRRPKVETDGLMTLIEHATRTELLELHENGIRMRFMGRRKELPASLQNEIARAEELTRDNTGLILNLALNYGGRTEIVDAARTMAEEVLRGELRPEDITEEAISRRTYAPDLPDPDLLIRTAGELRISNFLLWGIAYAEIWVTQTLWPDFTTEHLVQAIEDFQGRVRKFGAVVNVP